MMWHNGMWHTTGEGKMEQGPLRAREKRWCHGEVHIRSICRRFRLSRGRQSPHCPVPEDGA